MPKTFNFVVGARSFQEILPIYPTDELYLFWLFWDQLNTCSPFIVLAVQYNNTKPLEENYTQTWLIYKICQKPLNLLWYKILLRIIGHVFNLLIYEVVLLPWRSIFLKVRWFRCMANIPIQISNSENYDGEWTN